MDLPYKAEYAKTGRASCKGCKSPISQGELRIAVLVQSGFHDGKDAKWYHFECFFKKQRPKTTDDIDHFESLRIEDQDRIKSRVGVATTAIVSDKKGKKRAADPSLKLKQQALQDFEVQYSKSGRAMCQGCEIKILKDEVRISKKDFDTEIGRKYGGQPMWHHVNCFAQVRSSLGFYECGDKLPGFKTLSPDDQKNVKAKIPAIKQEDIPPEVKKIKTGDEVDGALKEDEYRVQTKLMFNYRDQLDVQLRNDELKELILFNKQDIPSPASKENQKVCKVLKRTSEYGYNPEKSKTLTPQQISEFLSSMSDENFFSKLLDQLADLMTFGVLARCKTCKGGQLVFSKGGYTCTGDLTQWTKCTEFVRVPKRKTFKVPPDLQERYPFLKNYKFVARNRVVKDVAPTNIVKKDEENADYNMEEIPIEVIKNLLPGHLRNKPILLLQGRILGGSSAPPELINVGNVGPYTIFYMEEQDALLVWAISFTEDE